MHEPYHKIPTIYKRDPANKYKTLLEGEFATPELEYLCKNKWEITEKIDGTNIRVMWSAETETVVIGGRSEKSKIPMPLLIKLVDLFPDHKFAKLDFSSMTLYGEGYGKGIQKVGKLYLPDSVDFILFDVKINDFWLKTNDVFGIAAMLGIRMVPRLTTGTLLDAVDIARRGFSSNMNLHMTSEGLVARPIVQVFSRHGHRIIAKIKCKDFRSD